MMGDSLDRAVNNDVEIPADAARAIGRVPELYNQSQPFDAVELKGELNESFWRWTESGSPEASEQALKRMRAQGWALQELETLTLEPPHGLYRLQIILTTLLTSSPSDREAMEAVPWEAAPCRFLEALVLLLKVTNTNIPNRRSRFSDEHLHERTLAAGRGGDYRELGNLIRHLETNLSPDVHLAVLLLARFAPERLARHIEDRQDVFFSVAVRDALAEDIPKFALSVSDVTFKFVCVSRAASALVQNAPEDLVETIRELLLQVAQTDLWRAWLLDFARYPQLDTVAEKALSEALALLAPAHWSAFVDAVELWTYSGTAGPVAKILVPFLHVLGNEKSADMWRLAFERWNKWDYGRQEEHNHLSAPSSCSFDFPVAMHYALLPLDEAKAEENRLLQGIANVEQKWFSDLSELVTYRNSLSSRLRLVQHGFAIRNPPPEGANALPPRIKPDSRFAEVRYRFFDVSARRG